MGVGGCFLVILVFYGVFWLHSRLWGHRLSGSGAERSGVESLLTGAPAAEQPELWLQRSARGGTLCLKEGVMKR